MKYFLRISLFFLIFFGFYNFSAKSQSLSFVSFDSVSTGYKEDQLTAKATVKNISSSSVNVVTKVNYLEKTFGHTYTFCDAGSCYNGDSNDEVIGNQPFVLNHDSTTGNYIHLYLSPNGNAGISKFKMSFYIEGNTSDAVFFNVTFTATFVSVKDLTTYNEESLSIYPNPANAVVNFKYLSPTGLNTKIEIFNTNGELITTINNSNDAALDLNGYSSGTYYSKITVNGKPSVQKKFVVTH